MYRVEILTTREREWDRMLCIISTHLPPDYTAVAMPPTGYE